VVNCCEHGNDPSGSIKAEFLDHLNNYQLLKKILYYGVSY
jgi:hypothetical protein